MSTQPPNILETVETFESKAKQYSSMSIINSSPEFNELVAMGTKIVPLIIGKLDGNVSDKAWDMVLTKITNVELIRPEPVPNTPLKSLCISNIRPAWTAWAKQQGIAL